MIFLAPEFHTLGRKSDKTKERGKDADDPAGRERQGGEGSRVAALADWSAHANGLQSPSAANNRSLAVSGPIFAQV